MYVVLSFILYIALFLEKLTPLAKILHCRQTNLTSVFDPSDFAPASTPVFFFTWPIWHFPLLFRFASNMLKPKTAPRWSPTTLCPYIMTLSLYKYISHNILQIFLSLFLDQITAFTFGIGVFFQDCTIAVSISSPNPLTFISMPWIFDPFPYNPFPLFLIVYSIFT